MLRTLLVVCFLIQISSAVLAQKVLSPEPGKTYLFEIKDGTTRQGKLDRQDSIFYYITNLATGPDKVYKQGVSRIKEIQVTEDGYFANPHYSRYVFGPSALPHPKGEWYWNNVLFEYNTMQYGISKNLSVGMGGLLLTTLSGNVALMPNFKYSFRLGDNHHAAVGSLAFLIKERRGGGFSRAALPFGIYTYGDAEANITAGLGWWVDDQDFWSRRPTYYLAGARRLSRNWVFQGEGFLVPNASNVRMLLVSMRNIRPTSCWDLGALITRAEGITIPLPVIAYTLKF